MRRWIVGLILLVLVRPAESWGAFQLTPEVTQYIVSGIDHMANLDYPEARAAFRRIKDLASGDLLYPYLEGIVEMDETIQTDWEDEEKIEEVLDQFLERMEPVVTRGEALLEATPDNPDLLLALGMIQGTKAVVDRTRNNYFASYNGIRASHRLLTRTLEVDGDCVDALWPLGLYDYAVSRVPALLKPLVALVLPAGGRDQGLERLKRAAQEGSVSRVPATVALVRILIGFEEQYAEALPYAERLATRYPGNPEFLFLAAFLYSETGNTQQALSVAEGIRKALDHKHPHFPLELTPRYLQLRGKIAMDAGAHEQALAFFRQAIEQRNSKYAWITAWAHTRTGMIYDLEGDREKAEQSYQRALEVEKGGLARERAKQYLSEPYQGKENQGSTQPQSSNE
ncbi:MAG: tetratricopeptide repeat protein [candidate division NC10 bacterium]